MNQPAIRMVMHPRGHEPKVIQPSVNGWELSWNPDSDRFHVDSSKTERTHATFKGTDKGFANAVAWARKNTVAVR